MDIYAFGEGYGRRYLWGYCPFSLDDRRKTCSSCGKIYVLDSDKKYVTLLKGNFVSNILWGGAGQIHVTEELKNAFEKEGLEGLVFEPTEIVEDGRPNRDKIKRPLERIPQFYRVKFLASIPLHPDFIKQYDITYCSKCGYETRGYEDRGECREGSVVLDKTRYPGTDFFQIEAGAQGAHTGSICGSRLCTEKSKVFLKSYSKTYCRFEKVELRD